MTWDLDTQPKSLEKTQSQRPVCCRRCGSVVARRRALHPEEHTFRNPAGYSFHVIVFEQAEGCKLLGEAVTEASWFDGFAWTLALCSVCDSHLGWAFEETRGTKSFYGLIVTRLSGL